MGDGAGRLATDCPDCGAALGVQRYEAPRLAHGEEGDQGWGMGRMWHAWYAVGTIAGGEHAGRELIETAPAPYKMMMAREVDRFIALAPDRWLHLARSSTSNYQRGEGTFWSEPAQRPDPGGGIEVTSDASILIRGVSALPVIFESGDGRVTFVQQSVSAPRDEGALELAFQHPFYGQVMRPADPGSPRRVRGDFQVPLPDGTYLVYRYEPAFAPEDITWAQGEVPPEGTPLSLFYDWDCRGGTHRLSVAPGGGTSGSWAKRGGGRSMCSPARATPTTSTPGVS